MEYIDNGLPFSSKSLNKIERQEFERALEAEAAWCLDKENLAVYYIQCKKICKPINKMAISGNVQQ
ncbi:16068_t:CDS:2 [Entrophospora sp. SA101]|nr:16068_t:CDS:2 [Entrophospora sp. SA101]